MFKSFFADGIFRRILKNFSWLLLGQIFTAIANFGYLSLTAHSLGLKLFGVFILTRAYVEVLIGITTFQSWQAFIKYGAVFLKEKDKVSLQNLIKLTTLLDILGSCAGFLVAIALAPYFGPLVGWTPETIRAVQYCSILILFTLGSTPMGLLRLYDRFNLLGLQQIVAPSVRLSGTIIALSQEAPFWSYLLVWVSAEALSGISLLIIGWLEIRRKGLLENMTLSSSDFKKVDPQIIKFCMVSNLNSSLPLAMTTSPLVIGLFANPVAVGLFRAGYELATPLKEIALILTQSVYPELAHLSSRQRWKRFKKILIRFSFILKGSGAVLLLLGIQFGIPLLYYSMGESFTAAYSTLILLVIAGVFNMSNYLLEPALFAMGLPHISLRVNTISILFVYVPLLVILTSKYAALGAGMATLISNASGFFLNSIFTWRALQTKINSRKSLPL
ncbi:MAG: oligosaccharide flippase family protein [Limnothrix sp.]